MQSSNVFFLCQKQDGGTLFFDLLDARPARYLVHAQTAASCVLIERITNTYMLD